VLRQDLWHIDRCRLSKALPQRLGQIRHRLEVGHASLINPAHKLARVKRLLPELDKQRLEFALRQTQEIRLFSLARHDAP